MKEKEREAREGLGQEGEQRSKEETMDEEGEAAGKRLHGDRREAAEPYPPGSN